MDIQQLQQIRRDLDVFLCQFDDCFKTKPSRKHLRTYVNGLISDLERKNVERIALDAGTPPRTLQEFLSLHKWDSDALRLRIQQLVMRDHADPKAIAVIDETSFVKKGNKTSGVQRQYCGASGKIDNCVVSVHLGFASDDFHTLVDGDLFLPEESWAQDRERCREVSIPDDVVYRPKWQIALDLLERSLENDMRFKYLTADELYGRCGEFRRKVDELGLEYVVEVPCDLRGWTSRRTLEQGYEARRADRLWPRGGPKWETFYIKDTHKGPVVWEARATLFHPRCDGLPSKQCWLIVARNVLDGETKYFLSNASCDTPLETMLHVAFSRWHIEKLFKEAKGEVGMDHFEVRNFQSLMRHLILSMLSLLFLNEEASRLRKKKSRLDDMPSEVSLGGAA